MIKVTTKGNKAWVTFTIHPEGASEVQLCGEWNEWENEPMKLKKSGEFYVTKVLPIGSEYQFGYRVNGNQWHCDDELECIPSPYGSQNALLKL